MVMRIAVILLVVVGVVAGTYFVLGGSRKAVLPGRRATKAAVEVGRIDSKRIAESSGLVASRTHAGVFWTHNDKGNSAAIYAIKRDGELIAEFRVDGKNDDWEDISIDDEGYLYIARTGNNDAKKDEVSVVRIDEPDPYASEKARKDRIKLEQVWRLRYPGKPFDAESLFIHGGHGYVVSKLFNGKKAAIYRFALDDGEKPRKLELVTEVPITSPATSADISRDGKRLVVLCGGGLVLFPIDGDVAKAGSVTPVHYPLPDLKFEGCCFTEDGVLLSAESREMYFCPFEEGAAATAAVVAP